MGEFFKIMLRFEFSLTGFDQNKMCFISFVTHVFLCGRVQFKYLQELLQPTLNFTLLVDLCLLT